MRRFRLEELLRVATISVVAVLAGAAQLLFGLIFPARGTSFGDAMSLPLVLSLLGICLVGIPAAVLVGAALHMALRLRSAHRLLLLPLFLGASFVTGCTITGRWDQRLLPMTLAAGLVSWLLYCFGPTRLWRFEFVSGQHSDF
jgi:energy-converting hydrogenase Eha subunit H